MTLTPTQIAKYLKNPNHCPNCDSENIEGGFFESDSNEAWQIVDCLDCGFQWNDIYVLDNIDWEEGQNPQELEDPKKI